MSCLTVSCWLFLLTSQRFLVSAVTTCNDYLSCKNEVFPGDSHCRGVLSCLGASVIDDELSYDTYVAGALATTAFSTPDLAVDSLEVHAGFAVVKGVIGFNTQRNIDVGDFAWIEYLNTVDLSGAFSVLNSTLKNTNFSYKYEEGIYRVTASGYAAIVDSTLYPTDDLLVNGYYGFHNSQAHLSDISDMELTARLAGFGSTVHCSPESAREDGQTCDILCRTATSCYGKLFLFRFLLLFERECACTSCTFDRNRQQRFLQCWCMSCMRHQSTFGSPCFNNFGGISHCYF